MAYRRERGHQHEFVQFHPTASINREPSPFDFEAVRGAERGWLMIAANRLCKSMTGVARFGSA